MSVILMTTLFYKALILQGEIWRWSLLGLKGLKTEDWDLVHQALPNSCSGMIFNVYENFFWFCAIASHR